MWVKFNCSSSDSNPPIHNYLLYNGTSLVDTDFQGHWIKKISPGHWLYNCEANQSLGITKSTNDISLTVFSKYDACMMKKNNLKCLRILETLCQLLRSGLILKILEHSRKRPNNYFDGGSLCQLLVPTWYMLHVFGTKKIT